jgi:4-hydroxythreonine-4-phosphate dehydrogenase
MKNTRPLLSYLLLGIAVFSGLAGCNSESDKTDTTADAASGKELPVEQAILTSPPEVPPPITRKHNAKVVVNLETTEEVGTFTIIQKPSIATCPITKTAMKLANSRFHGHTELIAHMTKAQSHAMMMAGSTLKVVLVTIHIPLCLVPRLITTDKIVETIELTSFSLVERFGVRQPQIAVAGLNPHAGEEGMFGNEEQEIIGPAVKLAADKGILVSGPFPPDTVFFKAACGHYDAVICMYHDQGLIPFKLIHFKDGINTTLGLPIIRTSVDHGTAYDIAWKTGTADPSSLIQAVKMAAFQAENRKKAINDNTVHKH